VETKSGKLDVPASAQRTRGRLIVNPNERVRFSSTMATTVQLCACMLALLMLTAAGVGAAEKQPWDGPAFNGDPARIARAAASAPVQEDPAQDDLSQKSQAIEDLLNSGKFEKAEPLVRECLRQRPHEVYFLSQLEMSLNGQGKRGEADKVAASIRQIWKSEYKARWVAKGSPVAESSWARIMTASKDYYVIGTEYFMPHLVGGDPKDKMTSLWADYKVIALPKSKDGGSRIFMLDKAASEKNYFLEEYTGEAIVMVAAYGKEKPDVRDLAKKVADYLDRSHAKEQSK